MKNKILSLILALCLLSGLITALPLTASAAASGTCGANLTWTLDDNGTLTISGTGSMYGYHVASYGASNLAPWYHETVKNVVIEKGVTSIGEYAFAGCSYLTSITIPDSVTYIGYYAFYKCTSLLSITIPNSVTSIGKSAFSCCYALSDIVISDSITNISESMFIQCWSLTNVTIPDSVTTIGEDAFYKCTSLSNVLIPNSVTAICNGAFAYCSSLKKIIIPKSIKSISAIMFMDSGLTSIAIPKSVTYIDHNAFSGSNLTDIYYTGSATDWARIKILSSNTYYLKNVKIHYNCTISGNNSSTKSDFAQISYNGTTYNLLTQPISIDKDSSAEVSVKVNYANCTADDKIYLSQTAEKYIKLENNVSKNIIPSNIFDTGKDIYVLIVNKKTGKTLSSKTKLIIASKKASITTGPSSGVEGINFKLGGTPAYTIPDILPFFGGTEIKWDFDFIPISVEYDRDDHNKINVVFGTNIAHADGEKGKFFKDFDFKKYKESLKKADSKQNRTLKQLRNDFRISNDCKMNLFGSKVVGGGSGKPSFDFDVAGYGEMKKINDKWKFVEGQICVEAEAS